MIRILQLIIITLLVSFPVFGDASDRLIKRANRYFIPLADSMPNGEADTADRVALGKQLFFEPRLSVNNTQSCSSCHRLEGNAAGMDNLPVSPGAMGELGTRNTPTVLNAGWQRRQFWDGRAADLVEQAKGPILNPVEMAMPDEQAVENKLRAIDEYASAFAKVFPGEQPAVTFQRIAELIAAFERTLISPSRFDDFLNGDAEALTAEEQRGLETFIEVDCRSCHDGMLLGGESLERLGKEHPYDNQADLGVYKLSGDEADRMVFKVASLRNVALTAPYFHDGRVTDLPAAVRLMGKLQLDIELSDEQVKDLVSFLGALTDTRRERSDQSQ